MLMDRIALALTIVGGINWGSIGLFRFDLVAWLFGLSALWCVSLLFRSDAIIDDEI